MKTPTVDVRPTPIRIPSDVLAWAREHRMGWCSICRNFTAEHVYDRAKNAGTRCPVDDRPLVPLWMAMQLGIVAEDR